MNASPRLRVATAGLAIFCTLGSPGNLFAQNTVTVPAGTRILVRTSEALSSGRQQTGARFTTKLEAAITVNGSVVVPAGATVYGRVKEARAARRIAAPSWLWS